MKKISVVVPVYYNQGSLPPLQARLQAVEAQLREKGMELELIFVDDGSGDGSFGELMRIRQARPGTKIIKLARNFGAVHASKCGMQHVTGDCFMVLAADLQDPPELILPMLEKWQRGCKFTLCARIKRDDPAMKKITAAIYYWLLRLLVMKDYPRGGYDLALMDKSILPYIQKSSKNVYTPLLVCWLGFKPEVIPYHRARREHGVSRWTLGKQFKAFLDVMLGFSATPIRLISAIGFTTAVASFAYGFSICLHVLLVGRPVPGFASIACLITFLLGLVIVMLGIIGEYLWRVFDEINKRPEVVIDEIYE